MYSVLPVVICIAVTLLTLGGVGTCPHAEPCLHTPLLTTPRGLWLQCYIIALNIHNKCLNSEFDFILSYQRNDKIKCLNAKNTVILHLYWNTCHTDVIVNCILVLLSWGYNSNKPHYHKQDLPKKISFANWLHGAYLHSSVLELEW